MKPNVLECSHCGGPLRFQVPFCAYCRAPVTWGETLSLDRGDSIHAERYPAQPMIGASILPKERFSPSPEGTVVTIKPGATMLAHSAMQARDMCVAVTARALDPEVGFAAIARAHSADKVIDAYLAIVLPGFRSVRMARLLEGGELSSVSVLADWECSPHVAPVGVDNTIEIRCADSMLQLLVNGQRMAATVDAGLGFGAFGWRAISVGAGGRVLFRSIEAFAVSSPRRSG